MLVFLFAGLLSCSDDETKQKGDPDLTHEGERWKIVSVDYNLTDMGSGTMGITVKSGTKANAGTFYFKSGSNQGSFELQVEGYNKEDVFTYTLDGTSLSIISIDQTVSSVKTNQNVIAITGEATETEMNLDGTIIRQSATSGQFILAGTFVLEKE